MQLIQLLSREKKVIVGEWIKRVINTYPADATVFLDKQKNQFSNPVGYTLRQETVTLFDELLGEMNIDVVTSSLDNIMKIRSLQNFSPVKAVEIFFFLKSIICDKLSGNLDDKDAWEQLLEFETRIDNLALIAFDVYTRCREKLFEIRFKEMKRRYSLNADETFNSSENKEQGNVQRSN